MMRCGSRIRVMEWNGMEWDDQCGVELRQAELRLKDERRAFFLLNFPLASD